MKLQVTNGPLAGKRLVLEETCFVGRSRSNDLQIDDPSLSHVHGRFEVHPDRLLVIDLGSTNGTFVNGKPVLRYELAIGDTVQMGDTIMEVLAISDDGTKVEEPADVWQTSGQLFDRVGFTMNRKIADGGMGAIYEGVQYGAEGFVKKVAIKTVLPEYGERGDFVAALAAEARLAADLVHPNIVQIYHLGRYAKGYYIAMEYIDGITLGVFLKRHMMLGRTVPVIWALYLVSNVARALDYGQRHLGADGSPLLLVHRDLSPNNIMIDREGVVKLTDFGVAKAGRWGDEENTELVGCVEFMSPEQAACEPVDGRSDLYALGLVLYELLTGIRLFRCDDGNMDRTIEAVISGVIPDPRDYNAELPDEVCTMLGKMLRRNPAERYRDAGMLADVCDAHLRLCGCLLTAGDLAAYVQELVPELGQEGEGERYGR